MEFCPRCGMRLVPTKKEKRVVLVCRKCKYERAAQKAETSSRKIDHSPEEQIAVVGAKEQELRTLPTIKMECEKCRNTEAYWWLVQTRGADESPTTFYRCVKCGYTWRDYS